MRPGACPRAAIPRTTSASSSRSSSPEARSSSSKWSVSPSLSVAAPARLGDLLTRLVQNPDVVAQDHQPAMGQGMLVGGNMFNTTLGTAEVAISTLSLEPGGASSKLWLALGGEGDGKLQVFVDSGAVA